jgi:hypothetical protein
MGTLILSVTMESVPPQTPQYPDGIKYTLTAVSDPNGCFNFATQNIDFSQLPAPPPGQNLEEDVIFQIGSATVPYPYGSGANVSIGWNGKDANQPAAAATIRLGNSSGPISDGEFQCSFDGNNLKIADADNDGDDYYYSLNFSLGTSPPTLVRFDPEIQNHPRV